MAINDRCPAQFPAETHGFLSSDAQGRTHSLRAGPRAERTQRPRSLSSQARRHPLSRQTDFSHSQNALRHSIVITSPHSSAGGAGTCPRSDVSMAKRPLQILLRQCRSWKGRGAPCWPPHGCGQCSASPPVSRACLGPSLCNKQTHTHTICKCFQLCWTSNTLFSSRFLLLCCARSAVIFKVYSEKRNALKMSILPFTDFSFYW